MTTTDNQTDAHARSDDQVAARHGTGAAAAMKTVAQDTSELIRAEIELAKAELKRGIQSNATGAGLMAGAAVVTWFAVHALLIAAGFALALVMPGWAAALTVGLILLVISAILLLIGRRKLGTPVAVDATKANVQEDVTWARTHLRGR